jgi:HPt (histidine-containing phosphotransfer) domain-containing protein
LAKPIDVAALEQVFSTYLQPDDTIISPAQTHAPAPRLPDIEGIDLHHLNRIFSDPNQVIEILKTFAHSQRDFCRKLHEVALDSPIFKRKIHALKGVSGSMAANEVHQQCKAIELATNASAKQTLVNTLCTTLSRLIHAIEAIHHNQASDRDQLIEPSHAQSIIDTTLAKLDANEFIASEERNRFFVAITHFEHDQRMIRQLEETFSIFDFKQAAAIIREIKSKHHGQ